MKKWLQAYWQDDSTPLFLLATVTLLLVLASFYISTGHDQSWMLHQATLLLEGGRPHQPIADPFIANTLIHVPPVLLAKWLHWHILFAFKVYCVALLLGVMVVYYLQLKKLGASRRAATLFLLAMLPLLFPPIIDFAQRDHWVFCFLLSYLLTVAARGTGKEMGVTLAAISGALAATAVLMKPHYTLVLIVAELGLLFMHRSFRNLFRPETIIMAILAAAYVAGTLLTMPDAFARELPMLTTFYWTYSAPWGERLQIGHLILWIALLASLKVRLPAHLTGMRYLALAVIAATYLAFLLLGNTWPYRQLPLLGITWAYFLALFHFWKLPQADEEKTTKHAIKPRIAGLYLTLFLLLSGQLFMHERIRSDFSAWLRGERMEWAINMHSYLEMEKAFADLPPVKSLFVMDTQLYPYILFMTQNNLEWPSRYHSLWTLPAWAKVASGELATSPAKREKMEALMAGFHAALDEDFRVSKPDVIIVDISESKGVFGNTPFDYIPYFEQHVPAFRELWQHYHHVKNIYLVNQKKVAQGIEKQREVAIYLRNDITEPQER